MPKYLCFTRDHNLEQAKQAFFDRYHVTPNKTFLEHGLLRVGPVPGSDYPELDLAPPITILDQYGEPIQLVMF